MFSTHEWTQLQLHDEAEQLYRRLYMWGWLGHLGAALRGRNAGLRSLTTALQQRRVNQHFAGRQTVEIQAIQGSEGRGGDFDRAFRPLKLHSRSRWTSLAVAWLSGAPMPAIDLIRVGEIYYVRDGHHRISVARALGHQAIDANVTVWQVAETTQAVPTPPVMQPRLNQPAAMASLQSESSGCD